MQLKPTYIAIAAGSILFAASCKSGPSGNTHGPIALGDSSTIVTETDSQYLHDFVADIQPRPVAEAQPAETPAAEQPKAEEKPKEEPKPETPVATAPKGNGLSVEFKDVNVFIPNVTTRGSNKRSVRGNGASFSYAGGELNGNKIQVSGMTVERVQQRYQTSVVMESSAGPLVLDALNHTSNWTSLKGNGSFSITGLDQRHLETSNPSAGAIQSAVKKELRSKRMSRKKEQEIMNEARSVRSVNQRPMKVILRTVIWQIEGKDAKGKRVHKEVRLDMPV